MTKYRYPICPYCRKPLEKMVRTSKGTYCLKCSGSLKITIIRPRMETVKEEYVKFENVMLNDDNL